ncbi:MAG: NC domain protein [Pelotomaculum sp. PtaU1.Bin035]|nr:MAG: NC domain protein [Pelotomaculum sp. PtaU1.Bin035]
MSKGDHLYVDRGLYTHHGIDDGEGNVIQYSGLQDGFESGPINVVPLHEFTSGSELKIKKYADAERKYSRDEIVARARSRVGEDGYSVWGNNCEHFAEWCVTGNHESKQVEKAVAGGAVVSGVGTGVGAVAVVSSAGAVAGLSGSGIMSGLAAVGGAVGGGAVAGAAALAGSAGAGVATILNNTVFKDDQNLDQDERDARNVGRKASVVGAGAATAGGIAAIAASGTAGLSAAGITSGLAAIGATTGAATGIAAVTGASAMAIGTATVVAAPAVAAVAVGMGIYKAFKWLRR